MPITPSTEPPLTAILPQPSSTIVGLEPIETIKSRWPSIIGAVLTLAMLFGLGRELFHSGLAGLTRDGTAQPAVLRRF